MTKISIDELDQILALKKAEEIPVNGTQQDLSPKQPVLRKPIDKAIETATMVGGGAAAGAMALTKLRTTQPMKTID